MKRLFVIALLMVVLAGCEGVEIRLDSKPVNKRHIQTPRLEYPTVNLPVALRQGNWQGNEREGSCVHAALVSLFRWQGRYAMADHWRRTYGNGEWPQGLAAKMDHERVRFAYTAGRNDVRFLDWACQTRRGCGVTVRGGRHMVCLVHFDQQWAGILDNNDPRRITWVPRRTFLAEWFNSNSWAVCPVYAPAPPLPYGEEHDPSPNFSVAVGGCCHGLSLLGQ